MMAPSVNDQREFTYIVAKSISHSIAPPMHNYIIKSLGYDWQFLAKDCDTIEDVMKLFRSPTFAGGVVSMPFKTTVMEHLDGLDERAVQIGACNNVYRAADGSLRGTNTDWLGVKGCLVDADPAGRARPALIIGAGGASRAALYALVDHLGCNTVYMVNRDTGEVQALRKDAEVYGTRLKIVHIQSVEQAANLEAPFYIVGTVPDFEPQTKSEIEARNIIEHFLSNSTTKGVLLDMCFIPRRTRLLKLGEKHQWKTVEGTGIIGHQIEEQYKLWCGEQASSTIDKKEAWAVLEATAASSPAINF